MAGRRGSVVPAWIARLAKRQPLPLTDAEMTRFFLTIPQAVSLAFRAMGRMVGGEIFILKMPVLKMGDLCDAVVEYFAPIFDLDPALVESTTIGLRPGEKMYELLMSEDEAAIALEAEDMFIIPPHIEIPNRGVVRRTYEGAEPAPPMGYDSRRDLPLGRRAILRMLQETYPEPSVWAVRHRLSFAV